MGALPSLDGAFQESVIEVFEWVTSIGAVIPDGAWLGVTSSFKLLSDSPPKTLKAVM